MQMMKNNIGSGRSSGLKAAPAGNHVTCAISGDGRIVGRMPRSDGHENVERPVLNRLLANKLLVALPADSFARLLPHVEPVFLAAGNDVYKLGEEIHHVYFPENAVVSHLHVLEDGSSVEAALMGREGIVGLSALFNAHPSSHWMQVAVAGSALRVRTEVVRNQFARGGALQRLVLSYANDLLAQLSQRAVCNSRHKVVERFSSWLLMVHDRAGEDQLVLTHEVIARHLGTRRAGVTTIVNDFGDEGIIDHGRGRIRVLNRRALQAAACECYRVLSTENVALV